MRLRISVFVALAVVCWVIPPWLGGQPGNAVVFGAPGGAPAQQSARRFMMDRHGLLLTTADGRTQMRVHGYLQGDGRLFATDLADAEHDVFLFRRVRPLVEGTVAGKFAYRFMPDFGQGKSVIQEVYAESMGTQARVRVGKFKSPSGLEVMRQDRALTFPERSLVSDLLPLRELGVQVEGGFLRKEATYDAGFFDGTEDGQNTNFTWEGSNEAVGRFFIKPFASARNGYLEQLGVGLAGSLGHDHNPLPGLKTVGQQTFFKYRSSAFAEGRHERWSPQGNYFHGPLGMMAEYAASDVPARDGTNRKDLHNRAWEISGSYYLTGEQNAYGIVQPARAFNPAHPLREHGAWELALRHSEARMDTHAFPTYADPAKSAKDALETGAGLSWYLNSVAKLMAIYEYTGFRAEAANVKALEPERLVALRLQLAF
jgi:phosphate-selective porin OprO/OprP